MKIDERTKATLAAMSQFVGDYFAAFGSLGKSGQTVSVEAEGPEARVEFFLGEEEPRWTIRLPTNSEFDSPNAMLVVREMQRMLNLSTGSVQALVDQLQSLKG